MNRIKQVGTALCFYIVAGATFISCEPQPDNLKLLDDFVVSTNYDKTAQFNTYQTFAIQIDTIGLVSNNPNDDTIIVGTKFARPVIQRVQSNLTSIGYAQVDKDANPDMAVNIYIVKNLNVFQQYNSGYNPGYYYPTYYGYSNYYYGFQTVSTYAYNTGALVMEIVDLANSAAGQAKIIWSAQVGDVYSSIDLIPQTQKAIDQAFKQSPYIIAE